MAECSDDLCGRLYENQCDLVSGKDIDTKHDRYPEIQQPNPIEHFPVTPDHESPQFGWRRHA